MTTTHPRRYNVGDTIPGIGTVVATTLTAYSVAVPAVGNMPPTSRWIPFYGPDGVDEQRPVTGLVTFADGSRYVGPCPCECNAGGFCGGCAHAGCGRRQR